ncbi:MAG: hypothetical protein RJQ01_07265 [Microcella sp.]|uniref:hypothetical protein n=1 Tax=Microcella sp. TaxID=1913979 RepID=UPI003315C7BE
MSDEDARRPVRAPRNAGRRITTAAPPGSDPAPSSDPRGAEPARSRGTENDERLAADKPPHY